jgi:hypothetical protein
MRKYLSKLVLAGVLTLFVWLTLTPGVLAATKTAAASGSWLTAGTWSPSGVPATGDAVVVNGGFTVTISTGNVTSNPASITIGGATPGTLEYSATTAGSYSMTVTGDVTVNSNGSFLVLNQTGVSTHTLSIGGNLTVNSGGTLNFVSTVDDVCNLTMTGTAPSIGGGGTIRFHSLTYSVSGGTLNLNSDISLDPNPTTSTVAALTVGAGAKFKLNSSTVSLSTLTATGTFFTATGTFDAGTGTVSYDAAGAQTVVTTNVRYFNLGLAGSGAKTLTSVATLDGSLLMSGSATATTATAMTVGADVSLFGTSALTTGAGLTMAGDLFVGDGTTFTAAGFPLTVTGLTTVGAGTSGNLTISSATGAKLFTGLVTVNAGATWNNSGNSALEFRGGITTTPTFTGGSGVHTFTTNAQALTGTFSIPSVTVTGITLTNNNTLTVGTALAGTGGLTQAANATLNLGGTSAITTLTATNTGNTVNYTGAAQTVHANNYYHLTLSGSGTDVLQTGTTTISGNLALSGTVSVTGVIGVTVGGTVTLGSGTTFTAGAFTHNVAGDWIKNGGTFTNTGSTINFNGSSLESIGGTASTTFNNLTINNSAGVTLASSETVAGILTLTNGQVTSTPTFLLAVTNTASNAVTGASSASYVNGPLQWSLATGSSYFFPVGDAASYSPFELNSITCASPVVRVTMSSTGASSVDATLASVAPRNWLAQLISGSFTSATVRITESGLASTNVVASSAAQSGAYTSRGGNSIGSTVTSNAGISYTASTYFAIGKLVSNSAFFQLFE